jgi:hypothetical protein
MQQARFGIEAHLEILDLKQRHCSLSVRLHRRPQFSSDSMESTRITFVTVAVALAL